MDNFAPGIKGAIFSFYHFLILPTLARLSDVITCASLDYVKNSFLAGYYQKNPNKFQETYFGVDIKKFKIIANEQPENGKNVLFVGGLDDSRLDKGLDVLIRAVKKLKEKKYNDIFLTVIGNGNKKDYYRQVAAESGLEKSVNFTENINDDELVKYYNRCDIFVLPSKNRGEAFGLVLLEAMSCGKPIIASDLPGVRSVFENGRQGLLAKPGDDQDLAQKLEIIFSDKKKAEEMGLQGKKLVEEKYTWENIGKKLEIIYKQSLEK
jgi:glycosyltransferase involved in cell wall biosynthesis